MARINDNYLKLKAGYLFPEIGRRVSAFLRETPDAKIIRMGIGDVTEPLPGAVVEALHRANDEMSRRETFHGYGPEQGYDFLREAIAENDYGSLGIAADEIFVSDGSKCDGGNILDIFGEGNKIAVTDPVYPIYVDTNVMAGHTGEADEKGEYQGLIYMRATAENREMAQGLGVNVRWMYTSVFTLGTVLGTIGGALVVPTAAASLDMPVELVVEAFAVVVIGGLGSMRGALAGALIVGIMRALAIRYYAELEMLAIYLVVIAILIARPVGLFGKPVE
jgi:hypothetical protein